MKRITAVSCVVLALGGCSSAPPRIPTEYDVVLARPKPTNPEAQRQECSWIETSLERQKNLANYVTSTSTYPAVALAYQDTTQRNMAGLQSRSPGISCQAPAGSRAL